MLEGLQKWKWGNVFNSARTQNTKRRSNSMQQPRFVIVSFLMILSSWVTSMRTVENYVTGRVESFEFITIWFWIQSFNSNCFEFNGSLLTAMLQISLFSTWLNFQLSLQYLINFISNCHATKNSQLCSIFQSNYQNHQLHLLVFLSFQNDFWYFIESFDHLIVSVFFIKKNDEIKKRNW